MLFAWEIKIRVPWMEQMGNRMLAAGVPERFADVLGLAGIVLIGFGVLIVVALLILISRNLRG